MRERAYQNASVLLYDPVSANLAGTRQALSVMGFQKVDALVAFDTLEPKLQGGRFDLVIAEVAGRLTDIVDMVRRARVGDLGANPFIAVILTSWVREEAEVRTLVSSGCDDVLLRPFSAAGLGARVEALVSARKKFVVTGDYIGPDRRKPGRAGPDDPLFDAPNTLKAAAQDDQGAMEDTRRAIAVSRGRMERERLRRLAMRVATAARLRLEEGAKADGMSVEEIDRAARELRRHLRAHGGPEAIAIAGTLVEITGVGVETGELSDDQLKLVRDVSMGAYAAFAGDEAAQKSKAEIDGVVGAIQARLRRTMAVREAG